MEKCPKCRSENITMVSVGSSKFLVCNDCGYDSSDDVLEIYPGEKTSQKAKSRHSPYKTGGHSRSVKTSKKN